MGAAPSHEDDGADPEQDEDVYTLKSERQFMVSVKEKRFYFKIFHR